MAKKRKVPALNSSSMADVSFILLIFFLVTTSMDSNKGLQRRLPQPLPPDQKAEDIDIKKRNIFVVKVNSMNQLLVQGEIMNDVSQLKEKAKEFIKNEANDPDLPENTTSCVTNSPKTVLEGSMKICPLNCKSQFRRYILRTYRKQNLKIMEETKHGQD